MKKIFLLFAPFVLVSAVTAQTTPPTQDYAQKIERAAAKASKGVFQATKLERKIERIAFVSAEVTKNAVENVQEQQDLNKLKSYVNAILQTGKETKRFSKKYTDMDVLSAMVQAKNSEEEPSEPEIYAAEEFLQYMREHYYTQNPSYKFPNAFTPTFMAKVLRILQ